MMSLYECDSKRKILTRVAKNDRKVQSIGNKFIHYFLLYFNFLILICNTTF